MSDPLSGAQYALRSGAYAAVIASVGASLRVLRHTGRDLVVPFDTDEIRPAFRGATLAPWPNRVIDGHYVFDGVAQQLALTEPARGHALHGLVSWMDFRVIDQGPAHVTLAAVIPAQAGYPWRVAVHTTYSLGEDGLTQTVVARNLSATPAPWGTGPHPYLVAGSEPLDTWTLELPARRIATVDDDRLVPTGVAEVAAVDAERFDFVRPRPIGAAAIDHAYTDLLRGEQDQLATVRVTAPGGSGVAISWDPRCPWVQVHTADRPGEPEHRIGLAVEPMTCPPDAFNSGEDLIVLAPGAESAAAWTIAAITGE